MVHRVQTEQIINAYRETGSVWKAARLVNLAGQTVHERLRSINYPMSRRRWDEEELTELREMAGNIPISKIAHELGRTYAAVACKLNELEISTGHKKEQKQKRISGFTKENVRRYTKEIDDGQLSIRQFARGNKLHLDHLIQAIEKYEPNWWDEYRKRNSNLDARTCAYCERTFYPMSGKARYCSRRCGTQARTDISYFGGRRREAIGLRENQCQLCGREDIKGLSAHHVKGKENDPDNLYLIALCPGCHKIITLLATRKFVWDASAWESVIQLAIMRADGHDSELIGVYACVEIERVGIADE